MKIAQICPKYFPDIGGVETVVKEISERLVKEGHIVDVITTDPTGKLNKHEVINGVNVIRFESFAPSNAYFFAPQIIHYLMKSKYDIIHAHNYHAFPALFSSFITHKAKFFFSTYYHGSAHTKFRNLLFVPYKIVGKYVFKKAKNIIHISNFEKKLLIRDFKKYENKFINIPCGVNKENITRNPTKNILFIGRLEEYKGVQHLIKLLPKIDYNLTIVGTGSYESELKKLANNLNVENKIIWLKNLSRNEILDLYSNAGVFVMLSEFESFGIVVAEALTYGVPSIVKNGSALSEFVDGKNCIGVDEIDLNELVYIIKSMENIEIEKPNVYYWDEIIYNLIKLYKGE